MFQRDSELVAIIEQYECVVWFKKQLTGKVISVLYFLLGRGPMTKIFLLVGR